MKSFYLPFKTHPKERESSLSPSLSIARADEGQSALRDSPVKSVSSDGKRRKIPLDSPPEKVNATLLSFAEKISRISRISDWLLFLKNNTPDFLKPGEFILFYESQQFGPRRAYIKNTRFYEETAQTSWPVPSTASFNMPEGNLYLTREMGRPFSRVLIMPFHEKNGSALKAVRPPVLFAELLKGRENKLSALNFFLEKKDIMELVLKRTLQNTHRSRASYLWNYIFESWGEALAIVRGKELIRANKNFKQLLSLQPDLPNLIKTKSLFQTGGRSYQFHYRPISSSSGNNRAESESASSSFGETAPPEKKTLHRPAGKNSRFTEKTNRLHRRLPLRENTRQNRPQTDKTRCAPSVKDLSEKGLIHCRDLTSYLQLKENFLQSEKMTAIGRLGQNIAHELNNPLTGLRAMSQILIRDKKFEKFSEDFRAVESAAVRSQKIIESFLTFSRSKKTEKQDCNVNTIVRETLPLLKTLSCRIEIKLSLKDSPPLIIHENPSLLQQMIFNLMTNACHAVRHIQGWQKARIEVITSVRSAEMISLEIKDNGCGISKDHREKIFQPLWTTKNPEEGTGLGLSIVRRFVQNAGGDICVVSELNKGSSFTIFLPLKLPAPEKRPASA